jgi:outer membrane protein TolC
MKTRDSRFARALVVLALATGARDASAQPASPQAASPQAAPDGVMLEEGRVIEMALRSHPNLKAARAAKDAAEAAALAASLARVPELRVSGRYTRLSNIPEEYRSFGGAVFPQFLDNFSARATLSIPLSDTFLGLAASARAAGKAADAALLDEVTTRAEVAYEARVAFFSFWSRCLGLELAQDALRAAERNLADQKARLDAGTSARNEALVFEGALDVAKLNLESARAAQVGAEAGLRVFLPDLGTRTLQVAPLDHATATRMPFESAWRSASHGSQPSQLATPPRIVSLERQADAAEARADAATLNLLPKLSAVANAEVAAPNSRVFVLSRLVALPSWDVGVQLEWSFSQLTVERENARQARAQHAALAARVEGARRQLEAERATAKALGRAAEARLQIASERVERASALAKARRAELAAGTAVALHVTLAESDVVRAKSELIDAFIERAQATARLEFIEGRVPEAARGAGGTP